jgi:mannosyltransferase OCH1-like enzyme
MDSWYVMGAVVITLVVCAIRFSTPRQHGAPRIIWTWKDKDTIVNLHSRASWKRLHPDHTIHILTPTTFQNYARVPIEVSSHPILSQFLKDIVRITVLAENGGIWLDSNVFLRDPLDTWLFQPHPTHEIHPKEEKIMGFMRDGRVDTSFLAALPGCTWLLQWKEAWVQLMRFDSIQSYATIKKKEGVPMDDLLNPLDHMGEIVWRTVKAPLLFLDQETMEKHMIR